MDAHVTLLKDVAALGKELVYRDADLNKWVTAQLKVAEEKVAAEQEATRQRIKEDQEVIRQRAKEEEARRIAEDERLRQRAREDEEREERVDGLSDSEC